MDGTGPSAHTRAVLRVRGQGRSRGIFYCNEWEKEGCYYRRRPQEEALRNAKGHENGMNTLFDDGHVTFSPCKNAKGYNKCRYEVRPSWPTHHAPEIAW